MRHHDKYQSFVLRSFWPLIETGDSDALWVIWLEIVRTPSNSCSRAISTYLPTCSSFRATVPVLTSTRQVQRLLPRSQTIAPSGMSSLPSAFLKRTSANVSILGASALPFLAGASVRTQGHHASRRGDKRSRASPAHPDYGCRRSGLGEHATTYPLLTQGVLHLRQLP